MPQTPQYACCQPCWDMYCTQRECAQNCFSPSITGANLYFKRLNGIRHYFANHPNKTDAMAYPSELTPLARRWKLWSLFLDNTRLERFFQRDIHLILHLEVSSDSAHFTHSLSSQKRTQTKTKNEEQNKKSLSAAVFRQNHRQNAVTFARLIKTSAPSHVSLIAPRKGPWVASMSELAA